MSDSGQNVRVIVLNCMYLVGNNSWRYGQEVLKVNILFLCDWKLHNCRTQQSVKYLEQMLNTQEKRKERLYFWIAWSVKWSDCDYKSPQIALATVLMYHWYFIDYFKEALVASSLASSQLSYSFDQDVLWKTIWRRQHNIYFFPSGRK